MNTKRKLSKNSKLLILSGSKKTPGKSATKTNKAKLKAVHLNPEEKDSLVLEHRERACKIACSMLRKWNCRLDLEEINSIVDLSLCEAVKNFDPSKGVSFITFMFYHLRGNLIRNISQLANRPSLAMEFDDEDLESGFIGVESINPADTFETLGRGANKAPDEAFLGKELLDITLKASEVLSDLEKQIIYGIYLQERQVNKIAKELKYSRCHISRTKTQALNKLRKEFEKMAGNEVLSSSERPTYKRRPSGKLRAKVSEESLSKYVA